MKSHIVRAPQTDRYGFSIPTKLSELEDDLTPANPLITLQSFAALNAVGTYAFANANTTIVTRQAFAEPTGADLAIIVPQTGTYLITINARWLSQTSSGPMTGRLTTPGTYDLSTGIGTTRAAIAGSFLRDNKLGPLTTNPGDSAVYPSVSAIAPLTAGDVLSPDAVATTLAATLDAYMTLSILRIA